MPTANERLQDAIISHSVDLSHYSNGVVRRIIALLNKAEGELAAQLAAAMDRLPQDSYTVQRLDAILDSLRRTNAAAYQQAGMELTKELRGLTEVEAEFQYEVMREVVPAQISIAKVPVEQAYAAALARPWQGRLLFEWMDSLEAGKAQRIRDAVRMGYVQNETIQQIVRRVRGTRAKGFADGLIEIDRRNAEAVVRTAVSHFSGFTRDSFMEANGDIIKAQVWSSTLDGRTSEPCILRDRKQYTNDTHKPIGHSYPWGAGPGRYHWNCRSTSVPVLKSWRELGIDMEGDANIASTRASMDGQVAAETSYGQWLKRQSAARQDEILGPTRGRLLRQGGLTVEKFANDKGAWLDLAALRQRHTDAFRKAGL